MMFEVVLSSSYTLCKSVKLLIIINGEQIIYYKTTPVIYMK